MKKKSINWQTVDWQKTNTELATELGYSSRHIASKRKELKMPNMPYKGFVGWENLDWSLPDTKLGKQIGYHPFSVAKKRKELGKPIYQNRMKPRAKSFEQLIEFNKSRAKVWNDIDWTKPDREIAEQINRSIASVCIKRKELGIAPVRVYDESKWHHVDWSKSNLEIMQETGVSLTTVYNNRKKFAPSEHKRPKKIRVDWQKVDWSLTNQEIAEKIGYQLDYVRVKRKEFVKKPDNLSGLQTTV